MLLPHDIPTRGGPWLRAPSCSRALQPWDKTGLPMRLSSTLALPLMSNHVNLGPRWLSHTLAYSYLRTCLPSVRAFAGQGSLDHSRNRQAGKVRVQVWFGPRSVFPGRRRSPRARGRCNNQYSRMHRSRIGASGHPSLQCPPIPADRCYLCRRVTESETNQAQHDGQHRARHTFQSWTYCMHVWHVWQGVFGSCMHFVFCNVT